eukprot:406348-Lingulodinium_polyedra.AAC.1
MLQRAYERSRVRGFFFGSCDAQSVFDEAPAVECARALLEWGVLERVAAALLQESVESECEA